MKNKLIIVMAVLLMAGCIRPEKAERIARLNGVTDVRITGYRWFACSDRDWYQTGFTGILNGQIVSGVICEGFIFKGSTMRLD